MFNSMVITSDPSPHPPVTFSAAPSPLPPPPPHHHHHHPFSYSSSLPSSYSLHRSYSTRSFSPPIHAHYMPSSPSSSSSTSGDYPDFNSGPFRRVFSAGDLQGMNGSPVPSENCGRDGGSVAMKAARYTAEERKERIERYRSKRHQRNFHKKITYACRKTLADSRPRVRGRFARNGDAETAEAVGNGYESFSYDNYAHQRRECSNFDSSGGGGGAGWGQNSEECCFLDEDLWVDFADVFPVNFPC
uniref:CCT domain-containing protein n=1 Tax=Ananas comosus var. bracteatus TaxID=296719 RepID=A0A6V7QXJ0_ANACO